MFPAMPVKGTEAAKSAVSGPSAGLRDRYDDWSSTYDEDVARYGWCAPARLLAAVEEVLDLEPHLRVVDLGVGTGQASAALLAVGARVTGLDLAPAMLERAGRTYPGFFRLVEHDLDRPLREAGLVDGDLDLVMGCGVLHFVRDLAGLIEQVAALLEAGGVFAFTYIPPQTREFSGATHVREPDEVAGWIAAVGLELLRHEDFVAYRQGGDTGEPVRYRLVVARDRRARPELPGALRRIDRTACVDRARLHALVQTPLERTHRGNAVAPPVVSPAHPDACDVLAIFAHPDDESVYAGSTLGALTAAGHDVRLVSLTDGAGGRGGSRDELAARRAAELAEAAASLGLSSVEVLGFDDFGKHADEARTRPFTARDAIERWGEERLLEALVARIRRHRPRVVLGFEAGRDPNYSLHGHHLAAGTLTTEAVRLAAEPGGEGAPWHCMAQWAVVNPEELPADGVRIEASLDPKARALKAHRSQAFSTRRLLERLASATGEVEAWHLVQGQAGGGATPVERLAGQPRRARPVRAAADSPARWLLEARADAAALVPTSLAAIEAGPVLTGQQAGIFGGPALTLLKAVGAVLEARRIGGTASFWMATQDHDVAEIARLQVSSDGGRRFRWPAPSEGRPVGHLCLGPEVVELRAALMDALGDAPHVADAGALLARHYVPGRAVGDAFAGLLAELLPELEMLDPLGPELAEASAPILDAVLRRPAEVLAAQRARNEQLRSLGLRPLVERDPRALPLFVTDDAGRRCPVYLEDHGLRLGNGERSDVDALRRLLARDPSRLTPDALLRPVCQDRATGAAIYVGGPSELGYWAQATALHELLGVRPAALRLRPHASLVSSADARLLTESSQLDLAPLLDTGDAGVDPWAMRPEAMAQSEAYRALKRARAQLVDPADPDASVLEALAEALAPVVVELGQAPGRLGSTVRAVEDDCVARLERAAALRRSGRSGRGELGRAIRSITRMERALLKAHRRFRRPVIAAARRLRPGGPQDRTLALIELVARFGLDVGARLVEALDHRGPAARGGAYAEWQQTVLVMEEAT